LVLGIQQQARVKEILQNVSGELLVFSSLEMNVLNLRRNNTRELVYLERFDLETMLYKYPQYCALLNIITIWKIGAILLKLHNLFVKAISHIWKGGIPLWSTLSFPN
jgi:hypothetical protein